MLTAGACLFVSPANAGELQIMPTRLGVSATEPTTTMFATNAEAADASYQVTVFAWSQHPDGSDQLDPTRDIVANPAIFTVKPGEQQIVRFGMRSAQTPDGHSYRVVLQELPRPNRSAEGIQALLRISVPIFVPPASPVTMIRWTLQMAAGGANLVARNDGNVHVQITGIEISGPEARATTMHCSSYVLPGISRAIQIHMPRPLAAGTTYHVRVDTDQGPMTAELRADAAPKPI